MHRLALYFMPPCCEVRVSRTKRGEVEEVVVSHIFQTSPVWSVTPSTECWCWCPHTPDPLHWTVHPLSNKEALRNILMNALSLLFTHPEGVLPVWHWAGDRQFNLCGAFSVSLISGVCSSRMVVVQLAQLVSTAIQIGIPSVEEMRKSQFCWRTYECPVHWFFRM